MTEEILGFLQKTVVEYETQSDLKKYSAVKIGATARFVAFPDSEEKLALLIKFLRENKIEYKILGRMTNILPKDENYEGVIIKTDRMSRVLINGNNFTVGAGDSLPRLSKLAAEASLSGLEQLSGIPGSVGGAICGNAGAYGREMSDLVSSVRVLDVKNGNILNLPSFDMGFDYRSSVIDGSDYVIISAELELAPSDSRSIYKSMRTYARMRRESQPVDMPSLGSVFKRPAPDVYPWRLIDGVKLRGYRIGGAKISEKHAGFIVNLGNATANDFISLVEYTEQSVYKAYRIKLSREFKMM